VGACSYFGTHGNLAARLWAEGWQHVRQQQVSWGWGWGQQQEGMITDDQACTSTYMCQPARASWHRGVRAELTDTRMRARVLSICVRHADLGQ
jgi:hypothetical protein